MLIRMPAAGNLMMAYIVAGKAIAAGVNIKDGNRVPMDEDVTPINTKNGWLISSQ
jgi:hypothetical protein